jgi:hypothetical protein
MFVISLVRDLTPLAARVARVVNRAAIHATTEYFGAITRHCKIKYVGFVSRYTLCLAVVLAIVNANVPVRVTRYEAAVGQCPHFPNQRFARSSRSSVTERDAPDHETVSHRPV